MNKTTRDVIALMTLFFVERVVNGFVIYSSSDPRRAHIHLGVICLISDALLVVGLWFVKHGKFRWQREGAVLATIWLVCFGALAPPFYMDKPAAPRSASGSPARPR